MSSLVQSVDWLAIAPPTLAAVVGLVVLYFFENRVALLSIGAANRLGLVVAVVYALWAAVVVLLYPACRWFATVKRRSQAAWMTYL